MSNFNYEVTSDDKLWALLAYVVTPVVPIILMLMEDKKNRPFLRGAQCPGALVLGIIFLLTSGLRARFAGLAVFGVSGLPSLSGQIW